MCVTLFDDEIPGNGAILVSGQQTFESIDETYDALGKAIGFFLSGLTGGHLNLDHDQRPA